MPTIATVEELKTKLRIAASDTTEDANLSQLLDEVEAWLYGLLGGRVLIQATYTGERHTGTGRQMLILEEGPLRSVTSAAIDTESSINVADASVIRYQVGPTAPPLLFLVSRLWTYDPNRPWNVTVTYDAGFTAAELKTLPGDVWSLVLDMAAADFLDWKNSVKELTSQSYMSGSISLFNPEPFQQKPEWQQRIRPVVARYKKHTITSVGPHGRVGSASHLAAIR